MTVNVARLGTITWKESFMSADVDNICSFVMYLLWIPICLLLFYAGWTTFFDYGLKSGLKFAKVYSFALALVSTMVSYFGLVIPLAQL